MTEARLVQSCRARQDTWRGSAGRLLNQFEGWIGVARFNRWMDGWMDLTAMQKTLREVVKEKLQNATSPGVAPPLPPLSLGVPTLHSPLHRTL